MTKWPADALRAASEARCQVVTRTILLEHVWDYGFDPFANVVDAAIRRLRRAVDDGDARPLIHTVRGVSYKIWDGV